jgi:signal transduction histidine kinase
VVDGTLVVEVTNERTVSPMDGEGRGLLTMRERAQAVGGVRAELPAEGD